MFDWRGALCAAVLLGHAAAISFTGNVERDFGGSPSGLVARATEADGAFGGGEPLPDVGVPAGWPFPTREFPLSGWDIKDIRLEYEYATDTLHIGINCWAICGDADADGNPSSASVELASRGGADIANLANSESFAFAMDLNDDGAMDFAVGVPSQFNALSPARYPCDNTLLDQSCFALYRYDQSPGTAVPSQRLLFATDLPAGVAAIDRTPAGGTSGAWPHLEWTVTGLNALRADVGAVAIASDGSEEWSLNFLAFAGSFQDDGVGEDQVPNSAPFATATFPCVAIDACDICGGNSDTCLDCAGIPNGPNDYDACDVCGGNGASCADCAGVPNGPNQYDECDVCNGNGPDLCGVCGGNNSPDCAGTPCGTLQYDACGVCGGDASTCAPERGVCSEEFGNVCKLHPGDVWTGAYRDNEFNVLLAGDDVQFTFAPNNYVMETNELGTHWNRFVITDNYLAVQELAAFPSRVARQCAPNDLAKYRLKFSPDCMTAEIEALVETCQRRESLYNGMRLQLQKPEAADSNECDVEGGSGIWQAKYNERRNAHTGHRQIGTFTFAPFNRAVVESSDSAVYFYTWRDETRADEDFARVRLTDRGSQDFAQTCGARAGGADDAVIGVDNDNGGVYRIEFGAACRRLQLAWPNGERMDECAQRAVRFDELTLLRVPLPSVVRENDGCYAACAARHATNEAADDCAQRCRKFEHGWFLDHKQ